MGKGYKQIGKSRHFQIFPHLPKRLRAGLKVLDVNRTNSIRELCSLASQVANYPCKIDAFSVLKIIGRCQMNRSEFLVGASIGRAISRGCPALVGRRRPLSGKRVGIGIIGSGARGREHVSFVRTFGDRAEIVAIADVDETAIAKTVKLLSQRSTVYQDYRRLLEDPAVDAVIVATPNFLHREHAIAALEGGRHVLCEKPLATTASDARAILDAAARSKKAFLVGHELRFAPIFLKMNELVKTGRIGRVRQAIHVELRADWNPNSWRYKDPRTGTMRNWRLLTITSGGTLLEKSCHYVDLFHMIMKQTPALVTCSGGVDFYRDGRETMDHATLTLDYPDGTKATQMLAMYHQPVVEEFRVMGTTGALVIKDQATLDYYGYGERPQRIFETQNLPLSQRIQIHLEDWLYPGIGTERAFPHPGDLEMHGAFYDAIAQAQPLLFDPTIALNVIETCLLGEISAQNRSTSHKGYSASN